MTEKRRRKGEGTIYQRSDGYWAAQINIGIDSNGRRLRKTFIGSSYEEVAAQFDIERGRIKLGGGLIPNKTTVGEWLDTWYVSIESKLKLTTRDSYSTTIKRIKKYIGGSKLSSISMKQITMLYSILQDENLSSATIMKTHIVLKKALDNAVLAHLILFNPVSMISHPKVEHKTVNVLSVDDQLKLAAHFEEWAAKGFITCDLLLFILETGMRVGEAIAFTWENVVENNGRTFFYVNKTAARVKDPDSESELKTKVIVGSTKTKAGERYIPATQEAIRILNRVSTNSVGKSKYVFSTKTGNMLQNRNIRRFLDNSCKRIGIEKVTIHGLRHTFSTRMYEAKVAPKERAQIMGHTDSRTTDKLYVSIDMNGLSNAIDYFEKQGRENDIGNR